jgi:hypothetical protein
MGKVASVDRMMKEKMSSDDLTKLSVGFVYFHFWNWMKSEEGREETWRVV